MSYYQQDMLSIKSRGILAKLFAQLIILNQTIQSYREIFSKVDHFDSIALFRFIDRQQKGYICEKDLQYLIETTHRKLLTYAFSSIDMLKLGEISRLDFAAFLLPRQNLELRQLVAKRLQVQQNSVLAGQTLHQQVQIFRMLLMDLINEQMKLVDLRHQLINNKDYSIEGVIHAIDINSHSWICCSDLQKFMKSFGYDVNLRQIEKLIQVINFKGDGKVIIEELVWFIEGLQKSNSNYLQKIKQINKRKIVKKFDNFESRFKQYLKRHKSNSSQVQKRYQSLMKNKHSIEKKERKNDQMLVQYQKKAISSVMKEQKRQLQQLKIKKIVKIKEKAKQQQQILMKNTLKQQLQQLMNKTISIQEDSHRLIRLQNKLNIYDDFLQIRKEHLALDQSYNQIQHRYMNKFDIQNKSISLKDASIYGQFNIPNKILHKAYNIQRHITKGDQYLNYSRQLRERIKSNRLMKENISGNFDIRVFQQDSMFQGIKQIQSLKDKISLQKTEKGKNKYQNLNNQSIKEIKQQIKI